MINLAPFGYYGGDIGNLLLKLEQVGFFSYVLPFLIIFSLVFGILSRMNIFKENKAINAIIALAVGLMALQFGFVSNFFSEIFPRLGVALSLLLAAMILLGLFMDPEQNWQGYVFLGFGFLSLLFVIISSSQYSGTAIGFWFYNYWPTLLTIIALIILIVSIVNSGKDSKSSKPGQSLLERALRES